MSYKMISGCLVIATTLYTCVYIIHVSGTDNEFLMVADAFATLLGVLFHAIGIVSWLVVQIGLAPPLEDI